MFNFSTNFKNKKRYLNKDEDIKNAYDGKEREKER